MWPSHDMTDYRVKAAILGDWSTGKTSMINCLGGRDLENLGATIGVGFLTQKFDLHDWCTTF